MTKYELTDEVKAEVAAKELSTNRYPTFSNYLDILLQFRIGQMLEKLHDGLTVEEALLGKSMRTRRFLLTSGEIRSLRYRGGMPFTEDETMAEETIPIVRESLERQNTLSKLQSIGIDVGAMRGYDGTLHIGFIIFR